MKQAIATTNGKPWSENVLHVFIYRSKFKVVCILQGRKHKSVFDEYRFVQYLWVIGTIPPKKASKHGYWEKVTQYVFEKDKPTKGEIEAISWLWYSGRHRIQEAVLYTLSLDSVNHQKWLDINKVFTYCFKCDAQTLNS